MSNAQNQDPMEFVRQMWKGMGFNLPGMVTPTFDTEELEKRITDLKAVEGWLRMNLSMLQMTIQGLEMQKATLTAVKAMGNMAAQTTQDQGSNAGNADTATVGETLQQAALWPWNLMQQMQDQIQDHLQQQAPGATPDAQEKAGKTSARKNPRKDAAPD